MLVWVPGHRPGELGSGQASRDCSEWEGATQLGGESWLSAEECVRIGPKKPVRNPSRMVNTIKCRIVGQDEILMWANSQLNVPTQLVSSFSSSFSLSPWIPPPSFLLLLWDDLYVQVSKPKLFIPTFALHGVRWWYWECRETACVTEVLANPSLVSFSH